MAALVFLTFAFLILKVQSQIYGPGPLFPGPSAEIYGPCGPYGLDPYGPNVPPNGGPVPYPQPMINNLGAPSFIPNQSPCPVISPIPCNQPIVNVPQLASSLIPNPAPCVASPVIATTVVDNTLANSLANAIQLLIVSNLIENTLGSSAGCSSLAQTLGLLDGPCVSNFEVVTPGPDYYPSGQIISCEYPINNYNPCINENPCNIEPSYYQPPCVDVSPCVSNFGPNVGPNFGPVIGPNIGPNCGQNIGLNCGPNIGPSYTCIDNNPFGFDNCPGPAFGIDSCSNPFGSPVMPSFGCVEPTLATIAPMAVEVPFPASIPAQLTCNFGYLPTNVPCVSVNVEPLPFDGCNYFGNFGNNFVY